MKKKICSLFIMVSMVICCSLFTIVNNVIALENSEYISYCELTLAQEKELLEKYEQVTVYPNGLQRSGTHSTSSILSSTTSPYGFVDYHPDTPIWDTATGYSVSRSKSRSFNIEVNVKVTNSTSIKIGAAAADTSTFSKIYGFTDAEVNSIRYHGNRSRLGVYAKVKKEIWHYKVYDNTSGQLLNEYNYAYITTWDGENNLGEVDYKALLKNPL